MEIHASLRKYRSPVYWYQRASIPAPLAASDVASFDALEASGTDPEVLGYAREIVDEVWKTGGWQGIALFGKPGRGKTSLTVAMLKAFIDFWLNEENARTSPIKLAESWGPAYFTTLSDYHDLGFEQMRVERMLDKTTDDWDVLATEWMQIRDRRLWIRDEVSVLVLDDIGKEHRSKSGYTESGFHHLMRGRWSKGLATCMTSNLTGDEFLTAYDEAQFSFLHEACLVLNLDGDDFRLVNA